jgi:membrane-associated phospholipid phosphatase
MPRAIPARLAILLALGSGVGHAEPAEVDEPPSAASSMEDPPNAVRWSDEWPRFRSWEYVATSVALVGALYLRFLGPNESANLRGGWLFDDDVLDAIALDSVDGHRNAAYAAHTLFGATFAYRLVDSLVLPLAIHDDSDLALQMSMIDLEAFGTVAIVLWGTQVFVRRERPVVGRHCDDPEFARVTGECQTDNRDRNRSFIAGHLATVLAGAGVTCMHHSHIPLYGGAGDSIACGAMIGAAGVTGALRMMTEDHHPTDTLLGIGLGAVAGWVVPGVLHYGSRRTTMARDGSRPTVTARVIPWAAEDRVGVAAIGSF